jgi:hypothetical protein
VLTRKKKKGLDWAIHARALGVDPRDPSWDPEFAPAETHVQRCMGTSVLYDLIARKVRVFL